MFRKFGKPLRFIIIIRLSLSWIESKEWFSDGTGCVQPDKMCVFLNQNILQSKEMGTAINKKKPWRHEGYWWWQRFWMSRIQQRLVLIMSRTVGFSCFNTRREVVLFYITPMVLWRGTASLGSTVTPTIDAWNRLEFGFCASFSCSSRNEPRVI